MWAKLDDALIDHRKVSVAGALIGANGNGAAIALGFFAVGLMWSNKHLTDGFLPREVVKSFPHVKRPLAIADALVQAGLFERADDGYQIHDFADYNPSAAAIRKKREEDRARKR